MNEVHLMNNQDNPERPPGMDAIPAATGTQASAGALLRQAREASGLHIAALAVAMKVPVKKLEALESDRLDLLPDAVFARALASSVCRTLKIDAHPILERLPQSKKVNLTVEARAANEPFNASGYSSASHSPLSVGKTAMIVVAVLMLGVALILWVPSSQEDSVPDTMQNAPTLNPQKEAAQNKVEEVVVPLGGAIQPALPGSSPAIAPLSVEQSAPVSVAPAPDAVSVVEPVNPETPTSSPLILFKTRGESWIEVVDAKGVLQMRKKLSENESASVSGALPLQVVVGRADVTEVLVRGQTFDISKLTQGNVARFEVR